MAKPSIRLLSIDGGGVRGIIPTVLLSHIEALTGRRIAELFDLVAGSSGGGFLTLLLTRAGADARPMYPASQCTELYREHSRDFFHRTEEYKEQSQDGLLLPKYPADGVVGTLERFLGDAQLKDACTDVLVTAYELVARRSLYFTRRAAREREADNFYMRDVGRAATAFPALLPAASISSVNRATALSLIDGGVFAVDPTLCGLAELVSTRPLTGSTDLLVVSLGSGEYLEPIDFEQARNWGLAGWSMQLLGMLVDAQMQNVSAACGKLFERGLSQHYYRFQLHLPPEHEAMDNGDAGNLEALEGLARELLVRRARELDALCARLVEPR